MNWPQNLKLSVCYSNHWGAGLFTLFFASAFLTCGCGRDASDRQTAEAPAHARVVTERPSLDTPSRARSTSTLELPDEPRIADLDNGSWESERLSRLTDGQLKQLAQQVNGRDPIRASQLEPTLTTTFTGRVPKLDELDETTEFGRLSIRRAKDHTPTTKILAADGLAVWFMDLLPPTASGDDAHLKFKTFGIELQADAILTRAWMQLDRREVNRAIQCSAILECRWRLEDPAEPKLDRLNVRDLEYITLESQAPLFVDCTAAILGQNASYTTQLTYGLDHWLSRLELYDGIVATSYHGLAIGDVNNDGRDDLYLCQPGGAAGGLPNRLFLQQSDGTAKDISSESGTDWLLETHSALLIDLDNDGDQDLVAATIAGLIFAENDGQARFEPRVHKLTPEAPAISLAAADFDADGDLDVYTCCYGRRAAAELMGRPLPYHDANNGARNVLFRNDRRWRFTNVTKHVGLDQNNRRFSLACAWEDFDNDGDQDLYVANDFGRNNLYQNHDGQFVDVAAAANVEDMSAGMSVTWGDYDNDGRMDLYVSNMWSSAGNRIAYQRRFLTSHVSDETRAGFQRHARGNSLFHNLRDGKRIAFADVSQDAHVTIGGWAWSSRFVDINNDGWQDLVVANGYITQEEPHDL